MLISKLKEEIEFKHRAIMLEKYYKLFCYMCYEKHNFRVMAKALQTVIEEESYREKCNNPKISI